MNNHPLTQFIKFLGGFSFFFVFVFAATPIYKNRDLKMNRENQRRSWAKPNQRKTKTNPTILSFVFCSFPPNFPSSFYSPFLHSSSPVFLHQADKSNWNPTLEFSVNSSHQIIIQRWFTKLLLQHFGKNFIFFLVFLLIYHESNESMLFSMLYNNRYLYLLCI